MYKVEIPYKFPSLNEYINKCRFNKYAGNYMKQQVQNDIAIYFKDLPKLNKVKINFNWYEGNRRRDLDGIAFAKKFILDTMVNLGKLEDDNRNYVCGFTDSFSYGDKWKVVLKIEEVEDE